MISTDLIAQYLMIVTGPIMLIFGSIGNIFNICVFTIWSRLPKAGRPNNNNNNNNGGRTSNTPLYLLISSWSNVFLLLYPLTTRIMFDGFKYLATTQTVYVLCKFRYYALFTFDSISLTSLCMALLDRYFASSQNVRLRRLSTSRKRTKLIIFMIICLFGLHNIPMIIYYQVSDTGECVITSKVYSLYYLYVVQILLHAVIPIFFLSIFSILTYKQIRIIKQRPNLGGNLNIDKQSSRMILLLSVAVILSAIPYSIVQIIDIIVNYNTTDQSSSVFFSNVISNILFYTNPVSSFYIYYFSTPNFRNQVQNLASSKKPSRRFTVTINQVAAIDLAV